ncbi:MAG: hypothetical protein KGM99_17935 [Burkholderiales bacterium]|nr:hypothetical protein [Burkholderiales bacterium]
MKNFELILPFGIPPAGLEKDLLRQLQTPALARLIAAAGKPQVQIIDDFARASAHEYWLAGQFPPESRANSPSDTWNKMREYGMAPKTGYWFTMQAVHIHIARDHLVLTDQRRLELDDAEARTLFSIAQSTCTELGMELRYGDAYTWFLRNDDWADLSTATADAACGHNIDIWMPQGQHERAWRKLQNEIQMLWFAHDINEERAMRGAKPVNSVWLSGGAGGYLDTQLSIGRSASMAQHRQQTPAHQIVLLTQLTEASINGDWAIWLEQMQQLEQDWFAPALQALRDKHLHQLTLTISDARKLARFVVTPWALRKFWIKPSLHHLFTITTP